ncbi:uncharacterized protein [Littorina saxatilis]|uniref:uncharacterized protein n=1 Tax=Littorina saxatilis TaxID=31220 RepID=UPI0038B53F24
MSSLHKSLERAVLRRAIETPRRHTNSGLSHKKECVEDLSSSLTATGQNRSLDTDTVTIPDFPVLRDHNATVDQSCSYRPESPQEKTNVPFIATGKRTILDTGYADRLMG